MMYGFRLSLSSLISSTTTTTATTTTAAAATTTTSDRFEYQQHQRIFKRRR